MPIIEYYSPDTNKIYSFYARNLKQVDVIPRCPDGSSFHMERMISSFSITGHKDKQDDSSQEAVDDPAFASAMRETERLMAGIDADNPDPKQLGAALRKMAEISGEPVSGNFEEVVRKLEEGADPSELEEDLGDVLDSIDADDSQQEENARSAHLLKKKTPVRDPKLYDFEE